MRARKRTFLAVAFLLLLIIPTGCGKKTESWAYAYEPTEEVVSFYDNGKAVYKGNDYSYSKDDTYITLKAKDGSEEKLRYEMEGDTMLLYEKSTYKLSGEESKGSIVGTWLQDNGWSYVFTEDGTFSEEGFFNGHYSVDEEKSCIRLMYDDPIEDAYLYYTLSGDELTIDYPWPMTKIALN
ncbi:hypothetical protein SAMN02910275_00640 [Butyrivibrio sp. INlla18]|uniref:hypothetical protein n=1 Tax=Butyrivibrio sp. INlla18 TaxID=1520806 RepID=UPI00087E6F8D|nr:hypothetical protein [Butyrivibrio sp. INlla18]SDA47171.1 hypothetical protein SAMN02910275_00640 [Butyrivibrio sp. INlla18]